MITLNTAWNLVNFRSGLIRAFVNHGYEVVAVAPYDEYAERLRDLGCRYVPLPMDNKGTNPIRDFFLYLKFCGLLRREKPSIFLGYTVKPNIYGSLAAHSVNIPVINNVAGLGTAFIRGGWLGWLVRQMYRVALSRSTVVFFQNNEDRQMFLSGGLVKAEITDQLPGSGIDLQRFLPKPLPNKKLLRFLLIGRMMRDKGVVEFVEAARILKKRGVAADFCLLGFLDVKNQTAISRQQMDQWVQEGVIRYLGVSDRVNEEIAEADCVVLPSYREGTPRTLLEAAAMARPIVTTDTVGCREVVDNGVNGYLCQVRDPEDLAAKIEKMINLSPEERTAMGQSSREKAVRDFDEKIVIKKYLAAISAALQDC